MANVSVLLVCMGNICRSPMAHAVLQHMVEEAGIADAVRIDSAATHSYHLGHEPHPETQAELARRGVAVGEQRSRLVEAADFEAFDFVVAMDDANVEELTAVAHELGGLDEVHAELSLLLDHADGISEREVPDPYYVGGYDRVYELVSAGCHGLLARIQDEL